MTRRSVHRASHVNEQAGEIAALRARVREADDLLAAINRGEVDAVVRAGPVGEQVFTLKGAERPYRLMVETMAEGAVTLDGDGTINYGNRQFADLVQTKLDHVIGSLIQDFLTPEDLGKLEAAMRQARDGSTRHRTNLRRSDGSMVPVYMAMRGLEAADGSRIVAVVTDLSELRRSEQYARSLIEASLDPLVTISPEGKITDVNKATEDATGRSRSGLVGTDFADYFTEPDKARAGYKQVFSAGSIIDYPLALRHVSGTVIDVLYNASIYRDEAGRMSGIFAAARNVTELKKAQSVRDLLARIVDSADDAIIGKDLDGIITTWNRGAEAIYGYSATEAVGRSIEMLALPGREGEIMELVRQIREGKAISHYETLRRRKDGAAIDISVSLSSIKDANAKVVGVSTIARDVTEWKRAERELAKYREHLEELVKERTGDLTRANALLLGVNEELEAFGYSVSHDLRTPLRAIDGFSQILLEDYAGKLDAEGQRVVHVIRDGAQKMGRLIDDILAFSRVGRAELVSASVDMADLVRATLTELEPVTAGRQLKLEVKPLPPAWGDRVMLQRVWTNLLDNAIKFTKPREPAVVEVGARTEGGETIYYVKDNGVGFDMQYAGKLFGVFQRLHTVDKFPGTGIGLAIVKRIVSRHGGRVWAEGKLNEGATLYFALPTQETQNA